MTGVRGKGEMELLVAEHVEPEAFVIGEGGKGAAGLWSRWIRHLLES